MTKKTPYITTSCDAEFRANAEDGRKYREEQSYQDLMAEASECDWIVYLDANDSGARRIRVRASSEMGAILVVEEEFGVTAISARPA